MRKHYYVYLLADRYRGIFYIGVTDDIIRRVWEHKQRMRDGFTKRYGIDRLVYYECIDNAEEAMRRERRLKRWNREWKIEAIEKMNPEWNDLYNVIAEELAEQDPRSHSLRSFGGE